LSQPHSLTVVGDDLYLCNSGKCELMRVAPDGSTQQWRFDRYTRGIAANGRWLVIGQSQARHEREGDQIDRTRAGSVLVCDRATMETVAEWRVPFREIYDIRMISPVWFDEYVSGSGETELESLLAAD